MAYIEEQPITSIERSQLVSEAARFAKEGYRLVQICCTVGEKLELTYSFDKNLTFANLRLMLDLNDAKIPSITGSYLAAFTYENELQDLFGFTVENLAINFNGGFYKTAMKTPFRVNTPSKAAQ